MPIAETIFVVNNPGIVTSLVIIDGEEIPKKLQVLSIKVETSVNKIPFANLVIRDCNPDPEEFETSNSGLFSPGKEIEIQLGYQKDSQAENKTVFKGIIIKNSHRINDTCTELSIDCKHEAERMTFQTNNAHYKDKKDSDIIKEILSLNHFDDADVDDSTTVQPQLMQVNKTDWDFIISRLDVAGMICLFTDSKIRMINTPLKSTSPSDEIFTLTYGKNILEFNGDMDARIKPSIVKTLTWDFKNQEVREVESDEEDEPDNEQQSAANGKKVNNSPYIISTPATMPQEAQKSISNSKSKRQHLAQKKARVKYQGITTVQPGDFIKLEGVGEKFNGEIFVSNIVHEYTDGTWETEASLGWNEKFFSEETNPTHAASASGQLSSMQGLHIGIVTNIEDSEGEYRVQVRLPLVNNNEEGIYARIATLDAGNNRGTFFRPELGDEVVLGFMNDDPSSPVVLGMLHSSALPSPLEPGNENNKKGYVSRSAIKLIFDDEEKSIKIETPGNRVFEMNDNAGTIYLKDNSGNKIIMDQSGITIESAKDLILKAKGTVSVVAPKIAIKADANLAMESGGTVSLNGGATTEIKGSLVKIN